MGEHWLFFFVRTEDGLRTRPLRDYAWNERLGFVILAVALVGGSITRSLGVW